MSHGSAPEEFRGTAGCGGVCAFVLVQAGVFWYFSGSREVHYFEAAFWATVVLALAGLVVAVAKRGRARWFGFGLLVGVVLILGALGLFLLDFSRNYTF